MNNKKIDNDLKAIVRKFVDRQGIKFKDIKDEYFITIINIEIIYQNLVREIVENEEIIRTNELFGFFFKLTERMYRHISNSVTMSINENHELSEIVTRTCVEIAVTIQYILNKDIKTRLLSYMNNYFKSEDKRLEKWKTSINQISDNKEKEFSLDIFNTKGI